MVSTRTTKSKSPKRSKSPRRHKRGSALRSPSQIRALILPGASRAPRKRKASSRSPKPMHMRRKAPITLSPKMLIGGAWCEEYVMKYAVALVVCAMLYVHYKKQGQLYERKLDEVYAWAAKNLQVSAEGFVSLWTLVVQWWQGQSDYMSLLTAVPTFVFSGTATINLIYNAIKAQWGVNFLTQTICVVLSTALKGYEFASRYPAIAVALGGIAIAQYSGLGGMMMGGEHTAEIQDIHADTGK